MFTKKGRVGKLGLGGGCQTRPACAIPFAAGYGNFGGSALPRQPVGKKTKNKREISAKLPRKKREKSPIILN
jgi:hypothetical protein